jgi:Putative zinc-finger
VNCRRHQELLSDYLEGALSPPLSRELESHLQTCEDCSDLVASLKEVLSLFDNFQTPEPPSNLTELILERTRPALLAAREASAELDTEPSFWRSFGSGLAAAAVLAMVLLFRPPEFVAGWSRSVSQTAHQGYSLGVRTYHRTARWIEDLNVLRMTVGVAFENRLDRLNERLRDLEELRRRSGGEDESSRSGRPAPSPPATVAAQITYEARSLQ